MKNLSIKQKLGILSVLVISTFVIIFFLYYRTMHVSEEQMMVMHDLFHLEENVLELRKHEKDFILRKDLKYRDEFEKVHAEVESLVERVLAFARDEGVKAQGLVGFDDTVRQYEEYFFAYVDKQVAIGLDPKSGLYGKLRASAHDAEDLINANGADALRADMLMLRRNEKDFMLRRDMKYVDKFNNNYEKLVSTLGSSGLEPGVRSGIAGYMKVYRNDFIALTNAEQDIGLTHKEGLQGLMRETVHKTGSQLKNIEEVLNGYLEGEIHSAERLMYIILIVASILTGGLVLLLANSIVGRMTSLNKLMREFASGDADLTRQIDFTGRDELVEMSGYVNKFVQNLRALFIDIVSGVDKMTDENGRIATTVEQFNATFSDQAMQTSGVASAMEEMSASAANVSDVIGDMKENTDMAKQKVQEGSAMLSKSVGVINEISEKTNQLRQTVANLAESSGQIGDIINSINDIADQTNLLALNAAIEAARAGEAGRGFAVVADEVRKLAERTQTSIKEITDIITNLKNETDETSVSMAEANAKVDEGVRTMDETGAVFGELVSIVDDMILSNGTVAASVSEQMDAVQTVSMNAQAISSGVEESAATVEEISHSTSMLSDSASSLKSQMSRFKV